VTEWRTLIRKSGLTEQYNAALCTLPLDLAYGTGFTIAVNKTNMGLSLESATRAGGSVVGLCLTIPRQDDRIVFDYTELSEDLTNVMCVGRENKRANSVNPGVFIVTQFALSAREYAVQVQYNREGFYFGNIINEEILHKCCRKFGTRF